MLIKGDPREITVKQKDLAKVIGVSAPRVSQLIQDGIIIRDEESTGGAVMLCESLKNYYQSKQSYQSDGKNVNYWEEKAKHERAKRKIAELRIARMENHVYDAKTVELVMTEQLSNLRTQLLGLPSKLAPQLEGMARENIYEVMTKEIEEKLMELSEYTPELFSEEFEEESNEEMD